MAREIPFAALPLLFLLHQLVEAAVWAAADGDVSETLGRAAATVYVLVALPLLPTLVPAAVLLLEPHEARRRVAGFVVLGAVVSAYLLWAVLRAPVEVSVDPWALRYSVNLSHGLGCAAAYIVAVIGPSLLSGYRSITLFGVVNLVGLVGVAILYVQAFASLWCVLAAVSSGLVLVHMHQRARLPDADRLDATRPDPAEV